MNAGRLIALEGLDGCGKSTQHARLVEALAEAGHDVVATREPTDGPLGRRIREIAGSGEAAPPEEELRLFVADRREHVGDVIGPALAMGRVVVTDRYFLSTVAYQGARGLDWSDLLARSEAEFPLPDLVLLFEISAEEGLARVRARGDALDPHFERVDFLSRVAEIFSALDRPYLERIDATADADAVARDARAAVGRRLGLLPAS